jgi:hypothetical protein
MLCDMRVWNALFRLKLIAAQNWALGHPGPARPLTAAYRYSSPNRNLGAV